ncbi:hypothetical protein Glove_209g166 [Diversispora epigaea]|uniref:Nuclear pore complex protein Nup85 n=1 Tax=Diversispora epigaea TaxID=1348612 RepID=A0A397IID7_9GLOM|nr:hypothetical protein Glove_209g166 [Diversispora epigaea]
MSISNNRLPDVPFTFQSERSHSDLEDFIPTPSSPRNNDVGVFRLSQIIISDNEEPFIEYSESSDEKQLVYLNPPYIQENDVDWSETNKTLGVKFKPNSRNNLICYLMGKAPQEEYEEKDDRPDDQVYEFSPFDVNNNRAAFYNESFMRILKAVECDKEQKNPRVLTITNLSKVYWDYAKILENHVEKLKSQGKRTYTELNTFQNILIIWELCGIIYINPKKEYHEELSRIFQNSYGRLSKELTDWSNKYLHLLDPFEFDETNFIEVNIQNDDDFWRCLRKLVLRGSPRAIDLLDLALNNEDEDGFVVEYLMQIKQMIFSRPQYRQKEFDKFSNFFREWSDKIKGFKNELLSQRNENFPGNIISICDILLGDTEFILENSSSWIEALMSMVISHPLWDVQVLSEKARECLYRWPFNKENNEPKTLDKIIALFFHRDLEQGIKYCEDIDEWLVAHLSDMFKKFELIGKIRFQSHRHIKTNGSTTDVDIREFSLLNFAESFVSHHSLWQLAFKYFELCETYGKSYIAEHIVRIPFDNERKLSKILNICKHNGLDFQAKTILRIAGKRCLQEKRYVSSIKYFMDAGDTASLEVIFRIFLDYYTDTGDLSMFNQLESVQLDESSPDSMKFLSRYRQFHELMQSRFYQKARIYIMELIRSQIAPTTFLPVLVLNTLPLFRVAQQNNTVILTNADNFEILRNLYNLVHGMYQDECVNCLERMRSWHTYTNGYADIDEKLSVLWTAVNNNQLVVYKYGEASSSCWISD